MMALNTFTTRGSPSGPPHASGRGRTRRRVAQSWSSKIKPTLFVLPFGSRVKDLRPFSSGAFDEGVQCLI